MPDCKRRSPMINGSSFVCLLSKKHTEPHLGESDYLDDNGMWHDGAWFIEAKETMLIKNVKALRTVVGKLGMQRVLWELASMINRLDDKDTLLYRNRYESQFSHDVHHTTAGERNVDSLECP